MEKKKKEKKKKEKTALEVSSVKAPCGFCFLYSDTR